MILNFNIFTVNCIKGGNDKILVARSLGLVRLKDNYLSLCVLVL